MTPAVLSFFRPILLVAAVVVALALLPITGHAATLRVPQDYPSVTAASNAAQTGDSILVWPPGPNGWENQIVTLQQGVTLRGMTDINSDPTALHESNLYMLESPPGAEDDTTRVENIRIGTSAIEETIHMFTPRGSITGCVIRGIGPSGWPTVRIYKGGVIARCGFYSPDAIWVREGHARVISNFFEVNQRPIAVFNSTAPNVANVEIRNNTVWQGNTLTIDLRSGSSVDVVNNIFHGGVFIECDSGVSIRYNDFFGGDSECPLGVGNIEADPEFCQIPGILKLGVSPGSPCATGGEGGNPMGAGGVCGVTGIADASESPRTDIRLEIRPNPVRSYTEFRISGVAEAQTFEIYDSAGRVVDVIQPGGAPYVWEPSLNVRPGVYFARLRATEGSATSKFVVLPR